MPVQFSVFTKPWREPIANLGHRIANYGFDGIELPVRPGYAVSPENVQELPDAVRVLAEHNVKVYSVAGSTDERCLEAYARAGVPIVRIMAPIADEGYLASEAALRSEFDRLLPLLERYDLTLGIQNHYGKFISNASGLRSLVSGYDPKRIAIVWDAAHNALNGEEPELAIDIVWLGLCMVNFKNAYWKCETGPESISAVWSPYWTDGAHGLASWPRTATELISRGYQGVVCLTAEYTDELDVDRLICKDISFARSLFTRT